MCEEDVDVIELFVKELVERHNDELNLDEHEYYLIFNDGLFMIRKDKETGKVKATLEFYGLSKKKKFYILEDNMIEYINYSKNEIKREVVEKGSIKKEYDK